MKLRKTIIATIVASQFFSQAGIAFAGTYFYLQKIDNMEVQESSSFKKEAVITLSATTLDFGFVDVGSSLVKTIVVTNSGMASGDIPISLDAAGGVFEASYDCGTSLSPGESCHISIVAKPTLKGQFQGSVSVGNRLISLSVGALKDELGVSSNQYDFGQLHKNSGIHDAAFRLFNSGNASAALNISSNNTLIKVLNPNNCTSIAPGGYCDIGVAIDTDNSLATLGVKSGAVTIGSKYSSQTISISASIIDSAISSTQTELNYGGLLVGASSQQSINVFNSGLADSTDKLTVTGLPASITANTQGCDYLAAGAHCDISFTYNPTQVESINTSATIAIGNKTMNLPVKASSYILEVEATSSVDFGTVNYSLGQTSSKSITVSNISKGPGDIAPTGFELTSSESQQGLSIASNDCTKVSKDSSCSVVYKWAPVNANQILNLQKTISFGTSTVPAKSITFAGVASSYSVDIQSSSIGALQAGNANTSTGTITITNNGSANIADGGLVFNSGELTKFDIVENNCHSLNVGQSCNLTYKAKDSLIAQGSASLAENFKVQMNSNGSTIFNKTASLTATVVEPTITFTGASSFGSVLSGVASNNNYTITNTSTASITTGVVSMNGTNAGDFSNVSNCNNKVIAPQQNCIFNVSLNNNANLGSKSATIVVPVIGKTASTSLDVTATVVKTSLSITDNIPYGTVQIGDSVTQSSVIRNDGTTNVVVGTPTLSGSEYSIVAGGTCSTGLTLSPGQTCSYTIRFTPSNTSGAGGVLTFNGKSSFNEDISKSTNLTGTGANVAMSISATTLPFDPTNIGQDAVAKTILVTNQGYGSADLTSVVATNGTMLVKSLSYSCVNSGNTTTSLPASLNKQGGYCVISVVASPTIQGANTAQLEINSSIGKSYVDLTGTGLTAAIDVVSNVLFDNTQINQVSSKPITISNSGNIAMSGVSAVLDATSTGYTIDSNTCTGTLAPSASCIVTVKVSPTASQAYPGKLIVSANGLSNKEVSLSTQALNASVTIDKSDIPFGSLAVGQTTSTSGDVAITNTGVGPVTVNLPTVTQTDSVYSVAWNSSTGCTPTADNKMVISVGGSCSFKTTAAPTKAGVQNGTISISSTAGTSSITASITGLRAEFSQIYTNFSGLNVLGFALNRQINTYSNTGIVTVTNNGNQSAVFTPSISTPHSIVNSTCGSAVAAGNTCTYQMIVYSGSDLNGMSGSTTGSASGNGYVKNQITYAITSFNPIVQTSVALGSSYDFGAVYPNEISYKGITLTNNSIDFVNFSAMGISSSNTAGSWSFNSTAGKSAYTAQYGNTTYCGYNVNILPGASCVMVVGFSPATAGSYSATVTLTTPGLSTNTIGFTGSASAPSVAYSPNPVVFPTTTVSLTSYKTIAVTNNGTLSLTNVNYAMPSSEFTRVATGDSTDCSNYATFAPGNTCNVKVAFTPTVMGTKSGLSFAVTGKTVGGTSVTLSSIPLSDVLAQQTIFTTTAPTTVNLGNIADNGYAIVKIQYKNTGNTSVTVNSIRVTDNSNNGKYVEATAKNTYTWSDTVTANAGKYPVFVYEGTCFDGVVAPNSSCWLQGGIPEYDMTGTAARNLTMSVTSSAGTDSRTISVNGKVALGFYVSSPSGWNNDPIGVTSVQNLVIANNTGVKFESAQVTSSSDSALGMSFNSTACSAELVSGASSQCSVPVSMTPTSNGTYNYAFGLKGYFQPYTLSFVETGCETNGCGSFTTAAQGSLTMRVTSTGSVVTNPANIKVGGTGSRLFSDGTYARSCKEYKTPIDSSHAYSGSTGDGIYTVSPNGTTKDVYCLMDSQGGGWTLVNTNNMINSTNVTMGTGTSTICTNFNCNTVGVSNLYVGSGYQPTDYLFTIGSSYNTPFDIAAYQVPQASNYMRVNSVLNIPAPGYTLYSMMTDSTPGWGVVCPVVSDWCGTYNNVSPYKTFAGSNGNTWSDGNWHGISGRQGTWVTVSGSNAMWGHHDYSGAMAYDSSSGKYNLSTWTYSDYGDQSVARSVSVSEANSRRYSIFVR